MIIFYLVTYLFYAKFTPTMVTQIETAKTSSIALSCLTIVKLITFTYCMTSLSTWPESFNKGAQKPNVRSVRACGMVEWGGVSGRQAVRMFATSVSSVT